MLTSDIDQVIRFPLYFCAAFHRRYYMLKVDRGRAFTLSTGNMKLADVPDNYRTDRTTSNPWGINVSSSSPEGFSDKEKQGFSTDYTVKLHLRDDRLDITK